MNINDRQNWFSAPSIWVKTTRWRRVNISPVTNVASTRFQQHSAWTLPSIILTRSLRDKYKSEYDVSRDMWFTAKGHRSITSDRSQVALDLIDSSAATRRTAADASGFQHTDWLRQDPPTANVVYCKRCTVHKHTHTCMHTWCATQSVRSLVLSQLQTAIWALDANTPVSLRFWCWLLLVRFQQQAQVIVCQRCSSFTLARCCRSSQ